MKGWEESRQRIALFGWVTEKRIDYHKAAKKKSSSESDTKKQTPKPLTGVQVIITEKPRAFADWLTLKALQYGSEWRKMIRRPDRTYTAEDGSFYFMDLPEGNYTLIASIPRNGTRYGKTEKKVKAPPPSPINIELAATSIIGRVIQKEKAGKPIAMAEVKVLGSGERVYTDEDGFFLLAGIEKGIRQVQVTAPGYQVVTGKTKKLSEAGAVEDLKDIKLKKKTSEGK